MNRETAFLEQELMTLQERVSKLESERGSSSQHRVVAPTAESDDPGPQISPRCAERRAPITPQDHYDQTIEDLAALDDYRLSQHLVFCEHFMMKEGRDVWAATLAACRERMFGAPAVASEASGRRNSEFNRKTLSDKNV